MATPALIVVWALSQLPNKGGSEISTGSLAGLVEDFGGIVVGVVEIELEGFERWKRDFMVEGTLHQSTLSPKLRIIGASLCRSSLLHD